MWIPWVHFLLLQHIHICQRIKCFIRGERHWPLISCHPGLRFLRPAALAELVKNNQIVLVLFRVWYESRWDDYDTELSQSSKLSPSHVWFIITLTPSHTNETEVEQVQSDWHVSQCVRWRDCSVLQIWTTCSLRSIGRLLIPALTETRCPRCFLYNGCYLLQQQDGRVLFCFFTVTTHTRCITIIITVKLSVMLPAGLYFGGLWGLFFYSCFTQICQCVSYAAANNNNNTGKTKCL